MTASLPWPDVALVEAVDFLDSQRRPVKVTDRAKMRGRIPYYGASGIVDHVNQWLFDEDLILLGEDGENILSRVVPLAFKIKGRSWVNNHAHVLRPRPGYDIDFLAAYLESLDYSGLNSGTAQPKLNKQSCHSIRVVHPPLPEQRAIARAIDDVSSLVSSLKRTIAKRHAIKRGMMQQLLTGRTRLPGFTDPWGDSTLGGAARVVGGGTPATRTTAFWNGDIPWFTPAEIARAGSGLLSTSERTITREGLANSSAHLVPAGSVLVTSRASIGNCAVAAVPVTTNQGFAILVPQSSKSTWFLYYWVQQNRSEFESRSAGSTFLEISAKKASAIPLLAPSLGEQEAIGAALRDADSEIAALARRLAKARNLKQGMIQQLLTGRTRLPVEAAA